MKTNSSQFVINDSGSATDLINWLKTNSYLQDESPMDLYNFIFKDNQIRDYLSTDRSLDLLRVELATHANAPAIQSAYHYYLDTVVDGWPGLDLDCDVWVDWGHQQLCTPSRLESALSNLDFNAWKQPQVFESDFVVVQNPKSDKTAVLYADIYSKTYMDFQRILTKNGNSFNFVLRFKPSKIKFDTIHLSGYGVELAIKKTDYIVTDDRKVTDAAVDVDAVDLESEESIGGILDEDIPSLQPLSKDRILNIENLLISYAANASTDKLQMLSKLSQDFPKLAHLIPEESLKDKVVEDSRLLLTQYVGEQQLLFLNGIPINIERLNAFTVLRMMRNENKLISHLMDLSLSASTAITLLEAPLQLPSEATWGDCFDTRSDRAIWLNDIESDPQYQRYPNSIRSILQPSYPGQLKYIRKNLVSTLLVLDFNNPNHLKYLLMLADIIQQGATLRFGILPFIQPQSVSASFQLLLNVIYYLSETNDKFTVNFLMNYATKMLDNPGSLTTDLIGQIYKSVTGVSIDTDLIKIESDKRVVGDLQEFLNRLSLTEDGAIFVNGYFMALEEVGLGELTDETSVYDYFMELPNVYPARNPLIFPSKQNEIELVHYSSKPIKEILQFLPWVYVDESQAPSSVSMVVIADLGTAEGLQFAINAVTALMETVETRLALIDNPKDLRESYVHGFLVNGKTAEQLLDYLQKLQNGSIKVESGQITDEYSANIIRLAKSLPGESACLLNGRTMRSIPKEKLFSPTDFKTLIVFESRERLTNIGNIIKTNFGDIANREVLSDFILQVTSIVALGSQLDVDEGQSKVARTSPKQFESFANSPMYDLPSNSEIRFFSSGDLELSVYQFTAIVQPFSTQGQKALAFLKRIRKIPGVHVKVFAIGIQRRDSDTLPLKRFYRYVFDIEPRFGADGPKTSIYDLDNIKLANVPNGGVLEAIFTLEYILVEGITFLLIAGHAYESISYQPPRGLQFVLGTPSNKDMVDTITMANLGYLQLKAGPGMWLMKIRDGRSSEVYQLEDIGHQHFKSSNLVIVNSYEGVTLHPRVSKKEGMDDVDVLGEGSVQSEGFGHNLWNQKDTSKETINVFSVASGHLYERFLAIMMLSVKKQTQNPVKFWLIENFLSPNFILFLPYLAKELDIEYELVTYKWPHWLRKQTEKQRIIWGYKILFLDVLFPLSVDKVIFVDADQVVRADLKELVDLDLHGAVYGYTPFCSSRTEMDGFRFWKSGYWESHLRGRPYHISALYVIDLVKFRTLFAGDRLRQQYHMLSADPNSLSNLDQDLPNNMIHEIPIHSLPQDWLWCETWCSDESLKTAKTIDLCNNPLTKEPKLDRAKRILPEWVDLDDEVQKIRDAFESKSSNIPVDEEKKIVEKDEL
ncbi:hypothetical protein HDV02_002364 [Globomyces sp. JEL0801]|nr:hypothetical protein HDV02_002364 [Globomyces sp. JEL0801]